MGEARNEFGAESVVPSAARVSGSTKLVLKTRSKLNCSRSGWASSDCTATPPWAQNKLAAKAAEEMKDPNFLAKTSITCLPVTGFDESNKRKPEWVKFKQQQAREGELLKTARRRQQTTDNIQ
jgi:hypothetical protein